MPQTTVSNILVRLSYELHALAEATDEFHHLAFGTGGTPSLHDAEFVRATQSIDHTQQILANLSDFVAGLGMAAPETMVVNTDEALSLITLSDLKDRLCDHAAKGPSWKPALAEQDSGELEFF